MLLWDSVKHYGCFPWPLHLAVYDDTYEKMKFSIEQEEKQRGKKPRSNFLAWSIITLFFPLITYRTSWYVFGRCSWTLSERGGVSSRSPHPFLVIPRGGDVGVQVEQWGGGHKGSRTLQQLTNAAMGQRGVSSKYSTEWCNNSRRGLRPLYYAYNIKWLSS